MTSLQKRDSSDVVLKTLNFSYDVRNRRIAKGVDNSSTYTLYEGEHAWADYTDSGDLVTNYVFSDDIDHILANYTAAGDLSAYLTDRQGTVYDRVDETGALVDHTDYLAFGAPVNPLTGDRFKYTGREHDVESGLYYYRARYYDPELGRFFSEDSIGFEAGDTNLYRYVGNAPGNGVDPSGESSLRKTVESGVTTLRALSPNRVRNLKLIKGGRYGKPLAEGVTTTNAPLISKGAKVVYGLIGITIAAAIDSHNPIVEKTETDSEVEYKAQLDPDSVFRSRRRDCDINDPTTWIYNPDKMKKHTEPKCKESGDSCFHSQAAAIGFSQAVLNKQRPNLQFSKTYCVNFRPIKTGEQKGRDQSWVCAVIRKSCSYHGYPSDKGPF